MSARHADQKVADGIHIPYAFEYTDSTEREGDSSLDTSDEGKFARQTDEESIWLLTDASGPTWQEVTNVSTSATSNKIDMTGIADTGVSISKGDVVYAVGHDDANSAVIVDKAQADASGTMPAVGVAAASFDDSSTGAIRVFGKLFSIDTSGMTIGDALYVSASTAGAFTNTLPSGPHQVQHIGRVFDVDSTSGVIQTEINEYTRFSNDNAQTIGSASSGTSPKVSRADHVHDHGDQPGGTLHAAATQSSNGFLSSSDKSKLDGFTDGFVTRTGTKWFPVDAGIIDPDTQTKTAGSDFFPVVNFQSTGNGNYRFDVPSVPNYRSGGIDFKFLWFLDNPEDGSDIVFRFQYAFRNAGEALSGHVTAGTKTISLSGISEETLQETRFTIPDSDVQPTADMVTFDLQRRAGETGDTWDDPVYMTRMGMEYSGLWVPTP